MFRYREAFHLSHAEVMNEPYAAIQQAQIIWSQQHERDKLEAERQSPN